LLTIKSKKNFRDKRSSLLRQRVNKVAEKFCLIAARQDRARKVFDRKCSKRKTDRPEPIGTQFKASLTHAVFAVRSFLQILRFQQILQF